MVELFKCKSWPEWWENYFLSKGLETKIWCSNSGRDKKEHWNGKNWQKCEHPRHGSQKIGKIPYNRFLLWILWKPIMWKILRSRGAHCYCPSSVVTRVVWRSYNVSLISLNLINYLGQWSVSMIKIIEPFPYSQSTPPAQHHTNPRTSYNPAKLVQCCE